MKLNPKVTGALAWGGLVVVLAIPAADMITRPNAGAASVITSDMDRVDTASATTREPAVEAGKPPVTVNVPTVADPVDAYVASGKKLPSYISDAPAAVAATKPAPAIKLEVPATAETKPAATASTQPPKSTPPLEVAALDPAPTLVAPEPYPASMRPQPRSVATAPATSAPAATMPGRTPAPALTGQPGAPAPQNLAGSDAPLIIDEDTVARREAAVARVLDTPPASSPRRIDGDRLQEWDSGSLADYLERRGLINEQPASVQTQAAGSSFEEDDDFFADRSDRAERRVVRRLPRNDFFLF